MRNLLFFGLVIFSIWVTSGCVHSNEAKFSGRLALDLVEHQLDFGYRIPGTESHRKTGDWIVAQLEKQGWNLEIQEFEYKDTLIRNILAKSDDRMSPPPIILGTHYDTRPHANLDPEQKAEPVPGANDGASGVAVLLELARVLGTHDLHNPVWLVFFDAEDSGGIDGWDWIIGSTYFADNLSISPQAVVIVDMVGDKDLQLYFERNSDRNLASQIVLKDRRSR